MAKNLVLGPILVPLDQIWAPKNFVHGFYFYYMLDIVASYQGKLITKLENIAKNLVLGNQFFFFKNLARSVIRYHGQLSSCTISEKPIDSILKKLDRRTDDRVIS